MDKEIKQVRYPVGFLRIQRKGDFEKIAKNQKYKEAKQGESKTYRKLSGGKIGETILIKSYHIELENKGYPKGFKNYDTYDSKYRPRNKTLKNY